LKGHKSQTVAAKKLRTVDSQHCFLPHSLTHSRLLSHSHSRRAEQIAVCKAGQNATID